MMRRGITGIVMCVALALTANANAQPDDTAETRAVSGAVQDDGGQPVAGAVVSIVGTGQQTVTGGDGIFLFLQAPTGALEISVQATGFQSQRGTVAAGGSSLRVTLASTQPKAPPPEQKRTVTGRITDKGGQPQPGAYVSVEETGDVLIADEDGRFVVENAPTGPLTLSVSAEGYEDQRLSVKGSSIDIGLEFDETGGGETINVFGRAPVFNRINMTNGAAVVEAEDLNRVSAQTVEDALIGKIAGANIVRNSGAPGGGVDMRLRGVSTIIGNSSPLFVIDGVIVSNVAIPSGLNAITNANAGSSTEPRQDNQVNRIADINPNDIANIEVLKGASAAALYGSKAANGVVIITTKRGHRGKPRVSVTQRFGFSQIQNKLGVRTFESAQEVMDAYGPDAAALFEPGVTYDHQDQLYGNNTFATETIASVSGGDEDTTYFGSILVKDEPGIQLGTGYQKQSGRVSFSQKVWDRVTVGASANVIHSKSARGLNQNDNNGASNGFILAFTPSFFDLRQDRANGVFPRNPFFPTGTNPLQTQTLMSEEEEVWRLITGANVKVDLFTNEEHDVDVTSMFGVDYFQQHNDLLFPPGLYFEPTDGLPGTSIDQKADNRNINVVANAIHRFEPKELPFKLNSSAGFLFEERNLDRVLVTSRNLVGGQANVDSGTAVDIDESRQLVRDRGAYIQEEVLLLDDALSVQAGILAEQSSANGDENAVFVYPKAAAAYTLPKLTSAVDMIRVRTAYGETGNQPLYGQKFTSLDSSQNTNGTGGLLLQSTAGSELKPERQREIEAGIDVSLFDDRVLFEGTVYQKKVSDLLLRRSLAPSTGFSDQFINGGKLRNRGVELMVQVEPVRGLIKDFNWKSRTIFTRNKSRITQLDVPAFETATGFGAALGAFRIEEGQSVTQLVGHNGLNPDGSCCVVDKLGDTEPDFRMSFANNFSYKGFQLSSLWDLSMGGEIVNTTKALQDFGQTTPDFNSMAEADQIATRTPDMTVLPPGPRRLTEFGVYLDNYVEDASFLKLREVSLSYQLPESFVKQLGPMTNARISVSGRNLLTFTNYSGYDPEVSNFGNLAVGRNIDTSPYAPSRQFWLSVTADL